MLGINQKLREREAASRPVRVGVSGAGWMGSGFIAAVTTMRGMEVAVVADPDVVAARDALIKAGYAVEDVVRAESVAAAERALAAGKRVITPSPGLAAQVGQVDIVAEVTASPAAGAETALACIEHGKDVVMVNVEADVTVGSILSRQARRAGVLYTVSSGDEPGALQELYDFVDGLGHQVVAVGKGKNNPLDRAATPDSVAASAARAGKDPAQVASFVDGTKTMFEMACIANATGLVPDVRGMHGPAADLRTVPQVLVPRADGGLLGQAGVVDYVTGDAMAGGVFVVARVESARIRADLEYLKVGRGPYFCFFRPYHLWFLEAPLSVARAALEKASTLVPLERPTAEVMTVAKRDLQPGERLDGFGGHTTYGLIEKAAVARGLGALPLGLAAGATVTRHVEQGQIVRWADVALDETSPLVRLRREQDAHTVVSEECGVPRCCEP